MSIRLNLGCGEQRLTGYIGVDKLRSGGADTICDLNEPLPFGSRTVDHVYAKSVLEHVENLETLLREIERTLKPHGTLEVYVPHWSNPFHYSDPSHVRSFGLASFDYFMDVSEQTYRRVPAHTSLSFRLESARLIFESPFRGLRWFMKTLQLLVNHSITSQLFYEYHIAPVIPCYAIEYLLRRKIDIIQ